MILNMFRCRRHLRKMPLLVSGDFWCGYHSSRTRTSRWTPLSHCTTKIPLLLPWTLVTHNHEAQEILGIVLAWLDAPPIDRLAHCVASYFLDEILCHQPYCSCCRWSLARSLGFIGGIGSHATCQACQD